MFRKFVWLKMLKASARNWKITDSLKWKFLNNEKSTRLVGGPSIVPRPPVLTLFPGIVPVVGLVWKQAVLKYCSNRCGAFALGSHNVFGRLPAIIAGMLPSPAAS